LEEYGREERWVLFKNDIEVQIRRTWIDKELYLVAEMRVADEGTTCDCD
jgi:hypothetical protein